MKLGNVLTDAQFGIGLKVKAGSNVRIAANT